MSTDGVRESQREQRVGVFHWPFLSFLISLSTVNASFALTD